MFEAAVLIARILVGSTLLVAGIAKWRLGTRSFAQAIHGYRLLPADLPLGVARVLPVGEILVGVALLIGAGLPTAAFCAATLLTLFATAMASALVRGLAPGCGCSAFVREQRVSWRLVYRNLALGALVVPVAGDSASAFAGTFAMVLTAATLLVGLHLFSRLGARGGTRVLRITGGHISDQAG
jgi:uncharacterized membrane protein YphA (DoxX/SURF4 family)